VRPALLKLLMVAVIGLLALASQAVQAAQAQSAGPPTAVILHDGSGSMWGIMDGDKQAKLYSSRDTLRELLLKAAPQSRVGFTAFGHRRKGDCSDIEAMVPPEAGSADRIVGILEKFNPRGKGPLANGLREAAKSLGPGTSGSIILIHDGIDNCQQDACAAAFDIQKTNPKVAIHIVSLGLTKPDIERMACVAKTTGGTQFEANDQAAIATAITEAFKLAGLDAAMLAPQATAPAIAEAASGPPGLRLTVSLAEGGAMLTAPIGWHISKDGTNGTAVVERRSPEINEALPPGRYIVKAQYGLVTRTQALDVKDTGPTVSRLVLNAGSLILTAQASKLGDRLIEPVVTIKPAASGDAGTSAEPLWISSEATAELIVPAGTYTIAVRDGLAGADATTTVAPGAEARTNVVLETGQLELRASAFDGGPPLDRVVFMIAIDDPDALQGRREIARSATPNPQFTLQAGTYYVTARLGKNEIRERIAISTGDIVKKTLVLDIARLSATASLQGAQLPTGLPMIYRVFETTGEKQLVAHSTAAEPQFELKAGRYKVEAQLGTLNVRSSQLIDITPGKDRKTTFKLDAAEVRLGGTLQTASATTDSRVEIRDSSGRTVWRSRRGDTRSALLSPGTYTVRIETNGQPSEKPVELKAGEQRVIE
jgi:Ca-activated chloride channel homolog